MPNDVGEVLDWLDEAEAAFDAAEFEQLAIGARQSVWDRLDTSALRSEVARLRLDIGLLNGLTALNRLRFADLKSRVQASHA